MEILEICYEYLLSDLYELGPVYDYVIVGCGTAGSTLALRLSEDKNISVLVLEAGPRGARWFDIPAVGILLQMSSIDWKYSTVTQTNAAKAFENQVSTWPMGRIVGGSGRLNNMIYLRGHPDDFRDWFEETEKYNYDYDILPYFKKSEHHLGVYKDDGKYHSTKGPLVVNDLSQTSPLSSAFLEAVQILGYPIGDLNSNRHTGFMKPQVNIKSGTRWTVAHHLMSISRPNLVLQANTFVEKVLLKSNFEAYGVAYSYLGRRSQVKVKKGVILSAGVVGSPKLLMLSGIGPKNHLDEVGLSTKIDLPVGNNLQDHLTTGADLVMLNTSLGVDPFTMFSPITIYNYFLQSSGLWTTVGCEAIGVISTNVSSHTPDLQFMVIPIGAASDGGKHLSKAVKFTDVSWKNYFELSITEKTITASILPVLLRPRSKGTIRLSDKNSRSHPLIDPNYLSDPYDVRILLKGIELIKKIIKTEPMQRLGAKLNTKKFPGCENLTIDSQPYWECYIRHVTITSYHPIGTCKMGNKIDNEAVVDYSFRVHGTNKLFVVDASVIPSAISSNPNAAVAMLGEKAADEIKYYNYLMETKCNYVEILVPKFYC
ncbi:hypothetical protein FQA39_LY03089 [Lamprigera yunnana]|nr:hypothetical protein FQA39_LY03089 [Lamprigera yunnana]